MKKNVISLSIAALLAGFAGSALAAGSVIGTGDSDRTAPADTVGSPYANHVMHATTADGLMFNGDGIGHILLVPYYTAQNGNATLLTLTNTDTTNGKAVKVRFRNAANSDDVLDFQVYLSPGDVWTAEVSESASGEAQITFSDKSCTAPAQVSGSLFVTDRFKDASWTDAEKKAHTREGYVEIFNMADIPPTYARNMSTANPLFNAVKHVNGVAPCRGYAGDPISALHQGSTQYDEEDLEALGFDTPTTGLMGSAIILNRLTGYVSWTDNAEAVVAVDTATNTAAAGRNVFARQRGDIVIDNDTAELLTDDPLLRRQVVTYATGVPSVDATVAAKATAVEWDFPDLSTPYFSTGDLSEYSVRKAIFTGTGALTNVIASPVITDDIAPWDQVHALTTALAVKTVVNDFVTDPNIGASTDWTISMPTRRYHVVVDYKGNALVFNTGSAMRAISAGGAPTYTTASGNFETASTSPFFASGNVSLNANQFACINGISVSSTGREEETSTAGEGVSPGTASQLLFCGEVSQVGFWGTDTLYASGDLKNDVSPTAGYRDGWAVISTPGRNGYGLPVLGAAYTKLIGADVAGKSTNYGVHVRHRYTR